MLIQDTRVVSNNKIADQTFLLEVENNYNEGLLKPGQFFNLQVSNNSFPLLRRPFSISDITENSIFFMYKIVGEGTQIMANKIAGDKLNLLGPLGNCFNIEDEFDHYFLVGGGIGIAPFPFLVKTFEDTQDYSVLFGVRNTNEAHDYGLKNLKYSSDDGSIGILGNVIDLLKQQVINKDLSKVKVFACGPNPMLRALQKYTISNDIECEVSLESVMACGFGICQGCPTEHNHDDSYKLICKDGPVFNIRDIKI